MFESFVLLSIILPIGLTLLSLYLFFKFVVRERKRYVPNSRFVSLMVVMGSGGHTSEMMALLSGLKLGSDNGKYYPITFVTADNDELSKRKVRQLVKTQALNEDRNECQLFSIKRSRSVGQSYWTSIFTTLTSLSDATHMVLAVRPQLIICNGPAICVPICLAAKLYLPNVSIIFVESFCRTESLSLSGKILYYLRICDQFLVQWPQLTHKYKKSQYIGLLV